MAEPSASQTNILVVEDDPAISTVLEETLRLKQYGVRTANSPDTALAAVAEQTPDLVLMDVNLSADIDGIQTVSKMRETADVPVCFITAYSDDDTIARAEAVGPMAYLVKPFEVSDVTAMVTISLANARRMKERIAAATKAAVKAAAAPPPPPAMGADGFEDKVTGLPNRAAAESMLGELEQSGGFVTALIVDHVQVLKQRFGTAALDRIIVSYSQHLAQLLPEGCTLCRWGTSSFAIVPPAGVGSEMEREILRMHSQPMLYHLQLTGRSALLRVSSTPAVFHGGEPGSLTKALHDHLHEGGKTSGR